MPIGKLPNNHILMSHRFAVHAHPPRVILNEVEGPRFASRRPVAPSNLTCSLNPQVKDFGPASSLHKQWMSLLAVPTHATMPNQHTRGSWRSWHSWHTYQAWDETGYAGNRGDPFRQ